MNRDNDDAECMCPVRWLESHPYNAAAAADDADEMSHTEHSFCNYSLESLGYDTDDQNDVGGCCDGDCDRDYSESTNASGHCLEESNHSSCCCASNNNGGDGRNGHNGNPLCGDDDDDFGDEEDETVVRFGTISVREFAVTVADLPTSNDSCPVTLDWEYRATDPVPVNRYERCRTGRRRKPLHQLSLEERRQRVATTQGISLDSVKIMEVELMASQVVWKLRGLSQRENDDEDDNDEDDPHLYHHHHLHHHHDGPVVASLASLEAEERRGGCGGGIGADAAADDPDVDIHRAMAATKKALSGASDLSLENLLTAADVLSLRRPSRKKSPMAVTA